MIRRAIGSIALTGIKIMRPILNISLWLVLLSCMAAPVTAQNRQNGEPGRTDHGRHALAGDIQGIDSA